MTLHSRVLRGFLVLSALVPALLVTTPAQDRRERAARHGLGADTQFRYKFLSGGRVTKVPFELVNNHLLLPVSVNGSANFQTILDTGMPMNGLFLYDTQRVQSLELAYGNFQAQVGGLGGDGKPASARIAQGVTLSIGDLTIENRRVITAPPVLHIPDYHDGIIGAVLFSHFIVRINYDDSILELHDPAGFQAPQGASTLPITLENNLPYTKATVTTASGIEVPLHMVLDLGAAHAISLYGNRHKALHPPEGALETIIGRGLTGLVTGYVGRVRSFELAGQKFTNVLATFPDSEHQAPRGIDMRDGNLGSGILKRFNLTFDYAHERVLLEPNRGFAKPFQFDMSGIRLREDRETPFWIEELLPDSPASRSGLAVNDILTDVDGKTVAELGLQEVKELFRRKGKKITIGVQRGLRRVEVTLELRELV